ncbi:F0F1 ATP synthase subunit A [Alphaproteobacteria bacterium endosymbiont of Tiliacea citrago]|uniref:F0F1 ATP synthase subunit A n=1 Tax=Alphaproteobacteria bacterium endosymbiont of Tiliacea citrago TaxID=3077944 RepID=UPI00313ED2E0
MDFLKEYHRFVEIYFAGLDFSISNLTLNLLYPSFFIFIFYLFLNVGYYPQGVQNFYEMIYENLYSFILGQVGKKAERCIPCLMSLAVFIVLLNLSNLFPWNYAATSQFMVNFSLAIIVFFMVFFMGFKHYGIHIWKHFVVDVPLFMQPFLFILELLSFSIRPLTLAVRLSVNVIVGHLILHILGKMSLGFSGDKLITLVFSIGFSIFEVLVSFLQAYIFIMLACIYIAEMSLGH